MNLIETERLILRKWTQDNAESLFTYAKNPKVGLIAGWPPHKAAYALIKRGFETLGMTTIWCGYYDGNEKSKRVQEKLGFIYHHTCNEVPVPLLNEVRVGHTNVITKEQWKSHTQPDGKIHAANIEGV